MKNKLTKKIEKEISFFARAKVNLYLEVLKKIENGFHHIDSVVCFPDIGDHLTFKKSNNLSLNISGDFSDEITKGEDNLIIKAAKLMLLPNEGLEIHLTKNLPISSGIGGGSSNAAVTLIAISKLFCRKIPSNDKIFEIGSDTLVCLNQTFQRVQGKGEFISKFNFDQTFYIILVNMLFPVSTYEIFNSLRLKKEKKSEITLDYKNDFFSFIKIKENDLEKVTLKKYPILRNLISDIKSTKGCEVGRMSGSGGTCFGIFKNKNNAEDAFKFIKNKYRNCWVKFSIVKSSYS